MKEYMLRVLNQIDHQASWSPERHRQFLKKCEAYIGLLKENGNLIAAQPLVKEGMIVSGAGGKWTVEMLGKTGEVQTGYYHLLANSLDEAVELAKGNPEFEFSASARVEVRPLKMKEESTQFKYPAKS